MAISDGHEDIFLSFCNEHEKWRAQGKLSHELCSPSSPIEPTAALPSSLVFFAHRHCFAIDADKEGPEERGGYDWPCRHEQSS